MATMAKAFAALLLLCGASLAITLEEFTTPYLYPDEEYANHANVTPMAAGNGTYLLITMNGQDAFLLARGEEGGETAYSFVMDNATAFSVLREFGVAGTYPTQAELDELGSLISGFNESRYPREWECLRSVGLDRADATCEPDRCWSCMSVPVCSQLIPYNGPDFTLSIHNYGIAYHGLSNSMSNATNAVSHMRTGADAGEQLATVVSSLTSAGTHLNSLSSNHLFGCFELVGSSMPPQGWEWCSYRTGTDAGKWCYPLQHNSTLLTNALAKATVLKNRAVTNATLAVRANALINTMQVRADDRIIRRDNATFQEFFTIVKARADNVSAEAAAILSHVEQPELQSDAATLSGLMAEFSRYGAEMNYTAANSSAELVFTLSGKMEGQMAELNEQYGRALSADERATLALFEAHLVVSGSNYQLENELSQYALQKDIIDDQLEGRLSPGQVEAVISDLEFMRSRAEGITAARKSQLAIQGSTWLGSGAKAVSGAVIGALASVLPMSHEDEENYARNLPALLVLIAGVGAYIGCIAVFAALAFSRRIHLHKVSIILWAIIFAFLFIMAILVTITAHSIVQQEASRSVYYEFMSALTASPTAAIVVEADNSSTGGLPAMRACAESLRIVLAEQGKTVSAYEYSGGNCLLPDGTSVPSAECEEMSKYVPKITLKYGDEMKATFYAYYTKEASLQGNEAFHSACNIAKMFNSTG